MDYKQFNHFLQGDLAVKQYEAVIKVMEENGGYATLGYLYQEALKVQGVKWGTKTPFASIRRIVQQYPDIFFKIRPGLWALKSHTNKLPPEFRSEPESDKGKYFDHTYYQGLLVQIGNLKQRATFVPNQDKNRLFGKTKLADLATIKTIYEFSYPSLVSRASTIDVLWFNQRKMPDAAYEVEHTTDIQNSLLKFLELQDFNIRFCIVAPKARKAEFDTKYSYQAFRPLREPVARVTFWDYEAIAAWHTKTYELNMIETSMGYSA